MKRNTRGTKMLEAAHKELEREARAAERATQAYKTPPTKADPPKTPPAPKRKKPRQCQFV
tara:strand:- start:938 stop:1117 length:180 start_codon:yes stop_codon:yes gene_type:complete